MKQHHYYMYILECSDGSYYTGMTRVLDMRLLQHDAGYFPTCYTFTRLPVVLKYFEQFNKVEQAITREKQGGHVVKKKHCLQMTGMHWYDCQNPGVEVTVRWALRRVRQAHLRQLRVTVRVGLHGLLFDKLRVTVRIDITVVLRHFDKLSLRQAQCKLLRMTVWVYRQAQLEMSG
ncbi:MAG: GIY-YIG nuclease family protein [Bacteroidota bacterium]